jgi:diphosphomevalonate decarboxylase
LPNVKGQVVGNQANIKGSSDLYGVEFPKFTKISKYQDTFYWWTKAKTSFSTLGHDLMHNHPYAERRLQDMKI